MNRDLGDDEEDGGEDGKAYSYRASESERSSPPMVSDSQVAGENEGLVRGVSFQSRLETLKQSGVSVLVSGAVKPTVRAGMSRRLLGDPDADRHRILASADLTHEELQRYVPEGVSLSDDNFALVRPGRKRRGASAASPISTDIPGVALHNELRDKTLRALVDYRSGRNPASGEIRLGVATLRPLLDREPTSSTVDFVRTLGSEVAQSDGMAHFVVGGASSMPAVEQLADVVDIHIMLRDRPRVGPEHRWRLIESSTSTNWMPLE